MVRKVLLFIHLNEHIMIPENDFILYILKTKCIGPELFTSTWAQARLCLVGICVAPPFSFCVLVFDLFVYVLCLVSNNACISGLLTLWFSVFNDIYLWSLSEITTTQHRKLKINNLHHTKHTKVHPGCMNDKSENLHVVLLYIIILCWRVYNFCHLYWINTKGVTSGAGTAHFSSSPEFTPDFKWDLCCSIFSCLCGVL